MHTTTRRQEYQASILLFKICMIHLQSHSLSITFTINFVLEVLLNILGYAFAIRDSIQQANRRTILVQCIL